MNKLRGRASSQIVGFYCSLSDRPVKTAVASKFKQTVVLLREPLFQLSTKYQSWLKTQQYSTA